MSDRVQYIITWETSRNKYVRTKRDRWCLFYPGVNEFLYRYFPSKEAADRYIVDDKFMEPETKVAVKVEEFTTK